MSKRFTFLACLIILVSIAVWRLGTAALAQPSDSVLPSCVSSQNDTISAGGYRLATQTWQVSGVAIRGTLETVAGQRFEFDTLAELNGLLCEIGGWIDTPPMTNEARKAT